MPSNINIVITHPNCTPARASIIFTCNCNYQIASFCTSIRLYHFIRNRRNMFECLYSKLHMDLPIMNTWKTIFYKIFFGKIASTYKCSNLPKFFYLPVLFHFHVTHYFDSSFKISVLCFVSSCISAIISAGSLKVFSSFLFGFFTLRSRVSEFKSFTSRVQLFALSAFVF